MEQNKIISLFLNRDPQAIAQTKSTYGGLCRSVARRILPDERDIEECINDALFKAWNAIPPEHPECLAAYLSRVVRNLALDRYNYNHAEKRSTSLTDAFEELENSLVSSFCVEQTTEEEEFRQFLNRFLANQPRQNRIYFVRRYWYGESIAEIAAAYKVSEEKVKSSLFRTRNKLKLALERKE